METSPPRKSGNGRDRKFQPRTFGSPQVMLPAHLSGWPDVEVPIAPNPATKPQSGKKSFSPSIKGVAFDRSYEAKKKENRLQSPKNSVSRRPFALERPLSEVRKGSNTTRRTSIPSNLAGTGNEDAPAELNSSPLTIEDGSSERKERLKEATASQKQDKSTGKKKNKEKGGLENVFNARSPTQERYMTLVRDKIITPTQTKSRASINKFPALSHSESSARAVSSRSPSVAPTRPEQKAFKSAESQQSSQMKSAAMTEAELQANLLRRSGHREFSSHAFDGSNEDGGESKLDEDAVKPKKTNKKKRKAEDAELDPVKAEIAKQQASYNDYMSERMKKNPDHYFNGGVILIHGTTSEGESDHERIYDRRGSKNSDIVDNIIPVEDERGSAYKINTSRFVSHENGDQTWSVTKKDKDGRKRMRRQEAELVEQDSGTERSRKRARAASSEKHRLFGTEGPNDSVGSRGSSDDSITQKVTRSSSGISPTESIATYTQHQKPISLQQLRSAPPMIVIADNVEANADFIATLKSFWTIIPKALLHTTMTNLNKANRHSLNEKLKLCQEGKQTNPRIRTVTRINENGDEVELLEEYGRISEPDPHTTSSELTLLTAAKDLIVLLSAQRVGLGLSSTASPSREGDAKSVGAYNRDQPTQGCVAVRSPMEEELSRIASEYQKEIDKLREENRDLAAKLKNSKR